MATGWPAIALRRATQPKVLGAMAAVAIAAVVYSQFNIYGQLGRDSAIYLYGGQRVTHGVPPYASIMDPKGPLPGILCGFGVAVAHLLGRSDVLVVRAEFCALCIASVLGIYLLVLELWHSVVAAVAAAAVFTSFTMYAYDALNGPDGHTPGIVFAIFAMWLSLRKRWYLAGFGAALAFFSWQPLFFYPLIVFGCAVAWSPGHRLRAVAWNVAGAATPFAGLIAYYGATGYLGKLFEGTFLFPLAGAYRPPVSFGHRLYWIFHNIWTSYGSTAVFLGLGIVLLIAVAVSTLVSARSEWPAAITSPIILLIMVSFVAQVAYVLYDYIGWTHAFPLLPYGAVGVGAGVASLLRRLPEPAARRAMTAALLVGVAVLTAVYGALYYEPTDSTMLRGEMASACAIQRSLVPGTTLWVIDNPLPLVLLHRRNPDNYPYVGSGLAEWRVEHTPGGLTTWLRQITARSSIVVFDDWREDIPVRQEMEDWLISHGYRTGYIGQFGVYVNRGAHARMVANSIRLTRKRQDWPLTDDFGGTYRVTQCPRTASS